MSDALAIRKKLRDSWEYYAPRCLRIRTKDGAILRFEPNVAQIYAHKRVQEQLKRTGKVRAVVLKGRQQGLSTYVEGRFYWKISHKTGVKAYILAHLDDASANLFEMAKRYHDNCPPVVKPEVRSDNAKELTFSKLDSGYKVATAKNKESGRSGTVQFFHGSEVAFWPLGDDIVSGAIQQVPGAPGTEIFLESTANGPQGLFYEYCIKAIEADKLRANGEDPDFDYIIIFVPWFWQSEYRRKVPRNFERTGLEQALVMDHGLDDEQLAWRRFKISELTMSKFRREYPCTAEEAFQVEVEGALWKEEDIRRNRITSAEVPRLKKIYVGVDPSGGDKTKNDSQGIVTVGRGIDDNLYVLSDKTCKKQPLQWAQVVIDEYVTWDADNIIAEANFGGDMVKSNIQTADPMKPVKMVNASRGKDVRAQPVANFTAQNRVKFVGTFPHLEAELITWVPGNPSPNRLDALVWACTELMGGKFVANHAPHSVPVSSPFGV